MRFRFEFDQLGEIFNRATEIVPSCARQSPVEVGFGVFRIHLNGAAEIVDRILHATSARIDASPVEVGNGWCIRKFDILAEVCDGARDVSYRDERSRAVRFEISEGELRLAASGSEAGESEESIPVEYAGATIKVGFNAQYVLDFLGVAETDSVELQIKDEESAGQMELVGAEGYEYRYVVMPMRI